MSSDTVTAVPEIVGMSYLQMLEGLHNAIKPEWYLEIGTHKGSSLRYADCNFVAVDPNFVFDAPIRKDVAKDMFLFQRTSDDFFDSGFCEKNGITFNLAFLDGLHIFEALLKDFINAEKVMAPGGTILLHDCFPGNVAMTSREEIRGLWTGDVWRTLQILKDHRPDLDIQVASARPTGLVVIRNLDPENRVLDDKYENLVAEYGKKELDDFPGGLAGYYEQFQLLRPWKVIASFTGG